MGAVAPLSAPWIPEDDLLLKNAIEAGASLESLAKGAVLFSRQFTIQELEDRWRSLLYDPEISEEVSARILEIEMEVSVSNNPKSSRTYSFKGKDSTSRKRGIHSLRSHYHAMRKRICNEPHRYGGVDFSMPPNTSVFNGNGRFEENLKPQRPEGCFRNCVSGAQMSDHCHIPEAVFDIGQGALSEMPRAVDGASCGIHADHMNTDPASAPGSLHGFHADPLDSIENKHPDGVFGRHRIHGHADDISSMSADKAPGKGFDQSYERRAELKGVPDIFEENLIPFQDYSSIQETIAPQKLPLSGICEVNSVKTKYLCALDPVDPNHGDMCTGIEENQNLKPQALDCSGSFQHLGYSPPLPKVPIWGTAAETSAPAMPVSGNFEDSTDGLGASSIAPINDDRKMKSPEFGDAPSEPNLCDDMCFTVTSEEGGFTVRLDFTNNGEPYLFDVDEKGITNGSCFDGNNFLMNSPTCDHHDHASGAEPVAILDAGDLHDHTSGSAHFDHGTSSEPVTMLDASNHHDHLTGSARHDDMNDSDHQDHVSGSAHCDHVSGSDHHDCTSGSEPAAILDVGHDIPHAACVGESDNACIQILSEHGETSHAFGSGLPLPDISSKVACSSGPPERFVCCILNTEDPEIPCNDDFIPPSQVHNPFFPIDKGPSSHGTAALVSSSKYFVDGEAALLDMTKAEKSFHRLLSSVPEVGKIQPRGRMTTELPESDSLAGVSTNLRNGPKPLPRATTTVGPVSAMAVLSKENTTTDYRNFEKSIDSFVEKSTEESQHAMITQTNIADCSKQRVDMPGSMQFCLPPHRELVSGELGFRDQVQITSLSDEEDKYSDGEDELPTFSDIESMILDMDLYPHDQESVFYNREVSRYRRPDTKKTIIRLEQGAHSSLQRAIASHGAFAVFYGRHLKHYIKKPKVLLGRATGEIYVDIDLQREGRANKISRRQAIIEMDEHGNFSLSNMGKFSVQINGKEVESGKCCNLSSGCLIEIRGMAFIFEVNRNSVRQYLSNMSRKNDVPNSKFDWLPSEIS